MGERLGNEIGRS